jgi:glycosyltransferase involved in cell wall biosynthesis
MKIAIDANELCQSQINGVKIYTYNLLKYLAKKRFAATIYYQKKIEDKWIIKDSNFKHKFIRWPFPFWTYFRFSLELCRDKPDVLFMTIPFITNLHRYITNLHKLKIVVTIHDLAFLKFPSNFTFRDRLKLSWNTKRAVKKATEIIVPSQTTKKDIIEYYKVNEKKIKVIYHGFASNQQSAISNQQSANKYILFVGTIQPRKNIKGLIEAFEKLHEDKTNICESSTNNNIKLVIVGGKGWLSKKIFEKAKKSKFSSDIIFTGQVSPDKLLEIYQNAEVFVLPSFYEGFGLPILEAMANGVPVIAGNNSGMVEIVGEAGILINPYKPEEIAEAIKKVIQDKNFKEKLVEKGLKQAKKFRWEKCAEKTMKVLNEVGEFN